MDILRVGRFNNLLKIGLNTAKDSNNQNFKDFSISIDDILRKVQHHNRAS